MLRTLWEDVLADPGPQAVDAYQLGFVRVCAWLSLLGTLVLMTISVAIGQPERLANMASYAIIGAVGLVLLRAGRDRMAVLWVVWGIWFACTHTMFRIGGVLNTSVSGSYAVVILGAGWLLGTRQAVLMSLGTILAMAIATYGMIDGWSYIRDIRSPPILSFAALVMLVVAAGTLGYFAALSIRSRVDALQRSQGRFETLFRQSPVASAIAEEGTGVLIDCNDAYADLLGYRCEEMIGKSGLELGLWVHVADRTRAFDVLRRDGVVRGVETRWRTASGAEICIVLNMLAVEVDGKRRFVSQSVDITALKEAEAALRESEDRFVQAFRASPQALVIVRLDDGRMVEMNESFLQLTGYTRDEAMGRTAVELGVREDNTERDDLFKEFMAGGTVMNRAIRGRDRQGNVLDLRLTSTLIHMGGTPYIYASMINVTHEVQAQKALEQLNAELEARVAARTAELRTAVEELDAFSYTVAHDLNAPLRSIHGFASLLEEDAVTRLNDEEKHHLKRIRDATSRMGDLIADLLLLSRVTRTEMRHERVDLSTMARAISSELASQDPSRTVTWRIAQGLAVEGDRGLLQVALENLLGNAWKYSRNREDAVIEFGRLSALGEVKSSVFFVRDNGAGFDDSNASGLFKPFTRLHSEAEFEGSGVGLATVHRVIRRHGGAVWAESSPGRGATFYFTMPGVRTA